MNNAQKKVEEFFASYPEVSFARGDMIIDATDRISSIYYINKGLVRLYLLTEEGNEITAHLFKERTYFPMMIALSPFPNRYFFEAQTEVSAHKAPTEDVKQFVHSNPEVLQDITSRFADGIMGLLSKIENLIHKDAYKKVASLLVHLTERYSEKTNDGSSIIHLSHEEIASMLGVQRETVSRQIEKLQKNGALHSSNRKIIVTSIQNLKKEASPSI